MNKLNYERVFNTLVKETGDYVTNNHLQCMVLGISGGIDSTVVAAICYEVSKNTGIPLIGRSLPIKNKDNEFDVSKLVGEAFCDDFKTVSLEIPYTVILNEITFDEYGYDPVDLMDEDEDVYQNMAKYIKEQTSIANGNIQVRLRMIYLYNLASIHKGLVMSTDNQTEYQLGFWTIHGDVGDFDPLQDLWKTEVYGLAKWLVEKYKSANIGHADCYTDMSAAQKEYAIQQSIALTPTDGLGISNSDLEQIGAKSYDEVDDILQSFLSVTCVEEARSMEYLLHTKYSTEVVSKVWNRHLASEFKRKKAPIYVERSKYE